MALSLLLGFGFARALSATDDLRSQLDLFSQVLFTCRTTTSSARQREAHPRRDRRHAEDARSAHHVPAQQRAAAMDENFQASTPGSAIQFDIRDGEIVVISPIEGTPPYRLGIRAGDQIVESTASR
jgi:C-terminal processing protease CtpA/Prc